MTEKEKDTVNLHLAFAVWIGVVIGVLAMAVIPAIVG